MRNLIKELSEEITGGLLEELKEEKMGTIWQALIKELAEGVVQELQEGKSVTEVSKRVQINGKSSEEGLAKAEEKLNKVFSKRMGNKKEEDVNKIELDDLDDVDLETIEKLEKKGVKVIYPNLKYRKPKYQNVSEMLKYVESDKGSGDGVKLVIMNFND